MSCVSDSTFSMSAFPGCGGGGGIRVVIAGLKEVRYPDRKMKLKVAGKGISNEYANSALNQRENMCEKKICMRNQERPLMQIFIPGL